MSRINFPTITIFHRNQTPLLALCLSALLCLGGCGEQAQPETPAIQDEQSSEEPAAEPAAEPADETATTPEPPADGNYIELALNVYYNDADHDFYTNIASASSIYVTEAGQYTLDFDCERDLTDEARSAGVDSLNNLTAIYLLDGGVAQGQQSPLTAADIRYDAIAVDGMELTITRTEPKSAFKSSGIFDTNDPINAWDGSAVEEVEASADHVANFTGAEHPKTISVTFTLSGLVWGEAPGSEAGAFVDDGIVYEPFTDLADVTAVELSERMGNGINLGNTMEAYGHDAYGTQAAVSTYETSWGAPVTTYEMIRGMKQSGFDTLRIPVAWTNMMDYESGDYTIGEAYLARVAQITDWAIESGMFVIVNDHWDGGWWENFGAKDEAVREEAMAMYTAMWEQIAEYFKDYPYNLILESANEELGNSLNPVDALTKDEVYAKVNEINQTFVDVVRGTGGVNEDRFLLIAGFNTNIDNTCDARFRMPEDTASDKLFVSVHYYDPANYCLDGSGQGHWGLRKEYEYMTSQLGKMSRFVEEGYGVIIGEYGALNTEDFEPMNDRVAYQTSVLDNCDIYHLVPVLWDREDYYHRQTGQLSEDVAELYASRTYAKEIADAGYYDRVEARMAQALADAPEVWEGNNLVEYEPGTPYAWIMWNGGAGTYSVGDTYNPNGDHSAGIISHDAEITGAGTYTVGLEFKDGNEGLTFAALGIADGEVHFPGCLINIKEITCDGEAIRLTARPYTTTDDGLCTRVNLVNEWVSQLPPEARAQGNTFTGCDPVILSKADVNGIHDIYITFELIVPEN